MPVTHSEVMDQGGVSLSRTTHLIQDLARLVVALKGNRESLQHAVEVIDTVDSRSGCTLEEAWDEVLAGDSQLRIEDEE